MNATDWPCANYAKPATCLTAPSSVTGRCDFCSAQANAASLSQSTAPEGGPASALDEARRNLKVAEGTYWEGPQANSDFAQTCLLASIAHSLSDIAESLRLVEGRGGDRP